MSIYSVPAGAEVKLSTGQSGVTPWVVEVKRKGTIFVTMTMSGYKQLNTALISSIDGASLGLGTAVNFLFLPIVNDIVDYKIGANYSHKPNPLIASLIPVSSSDSYQLVAPPAAPPPPAPATAPAPAAAPAPATPPEPAAVPPPAPDATTPTPAPVPDAAPAPAAAPTPPAQAAVPAPEASPAPAPVQVPDQAPAPDNASPKTGK